MPLNPNIVLQAQAPTQAQNPLSMLAQILQIQQLQQKMQSDQETAPLLRQKLQAEINNIPAQEEQRRAAAQMQQLKMLEDTDKFQARITLSDLLNPRGQYWSGRVSDPSTLSLAGSDDEALAKFGVRKNPDGTVSPINKDNSGVVTAPTNVGVNDKNTLMSLMSRAEPASFIRSQTQAMNRPPERMQIIPAGAAGVRDGQVVHQQPFAPRAEPAPTVRAVPDSNGKYWWQDMRNPGVNLAPAPDPTINPANNNANRLAQQFSSHPAVKQYDTVAPGVRYAAGYIANIPKAGATAADDAALTKLFLAMTHPKGDQISNLDLRQLSQLPDLEDRVKAAISGFISGKTLPNEIRTQFWNVISNKFKYLDQERMKKRREIEERAAAMGADTRAIFGDQ